MNAKEELIKHTTDKGLGIKCVQIIRGDEYEEESRSEYVLPVGHTVSQKEQFLRVIDWNYNSGYGGQEVFGTIWYNDGTWSSRGEYDGSEWWNYNKCPQIPETLIKGAE